MRNKIAICFGAEISNEVLLIGLFYFADALYKSLTWSNDFLSFELVMSFEILMYK